MSGYVFCLWQTQSEREVSLSLYLVSIQKLGIKHKSSFHCEKGQFFTSGKRDVCLIVSFVSVQKIDFKQKSSFHRGN